MSFYAFLASQSPLPALYNPKKQGSKQGNRLVFQQESDLYALEILPVLREETYRDAAFYTRLPYLAELDGRFDIACFSDQMQENAETLLAYLRQNVTQKASVELWGIWLWGGRGSCKDYVTRELAKLTVEAYPVDSLTPALLLSSLTGETPYKIKLYRTNY